VRAQRHGGDQVGPGRELHAHTISAQVEAMVAIQGGQGDMQVRLLARN
jgi:hypothetical protein